MKICRKGEIEHINYRDDRFSLLSKLRTKALFLTSPLYQKGISSHIYGSLARGDVNEDSDIDIIILQLVNPALVISLYQLEDIKIIKKVIVQATPSHTPKLYLWFDVEGKEVVSLPLSKLRSREIEFYKFGGLLSFEDISSDKRVLGVDKRLMLIKPVEEGHIEECILGREGYVARLLNISETIVKERVSVLTKREMHGRTGVFLEYDVEDDVMDAINRLMRNNVFFRKMLQNSK